MQRLFSAFPEGWPGTGMVLLRAIAGLPLAQFVHSSTVTASPSGGALQLLAAVCSGLVVCGLWTPIAGSLLAISEFALMFFSGSVSSNQLTMAVVAASIAMIGPGAWSIDARLFGRKRIRIPQR